MIMQRRAQQRRGQDRRDQSGDLALIDRFRHDPEGAYHELLERYSPVILRMIRRFMYDSDEVMEVYTAICERFRANDYLALRRFRINRELTPWLSVVVANACRDRYRKRRMVSVPQTVIDKLDERERLVFKYYYQDNLTYQEIAALIDCKHSIPFTEFDVNTAIEKINDLLTINKRWHLLTALNGRRGMVSVEDLLEVGFQPASAETPEMQDERKQQQGQISAMREAISEMDQEDQLLVLLRYEQGMRAHQIAKVMNYENHKYVYTRLRTIVNRLRRQMDVVLD